MSRDGLRLFVLWVILTVGGEIAVVSWSMLPAGFAIEADVVDDAYLLLMVLGVPVFAFVVAALIYFPIRFRSRKKPSEDGPHIAGDSRIVAGWLVITSVLALVVLINPGFVGLAELRGEATADLVVEVEGQRWFWVASYPDGGEARDELVLPVDTRIRFDVTSVDILHSFWIPGFRTKIDAVPGRTTELYVTTDAIGSFETDTGLRVQCAELCGIAHSAMAMPVRIVEQDEFDAWVEALEEGS